MSVAITNSDFFQYSFLMNPSNSSKNIDKDLSWKVGVNEIRRLWSRTSITFGEPLYDVVTSLFETYEECSIPDWDGYGASSINEKTYQEAFNIIDSLPIFIEMPGINCHPSGEIAFEWRRGKEKSFIISVGGKNRINYAGIFGEDEKIHGSEYFEEALPSVVINNLRRLYSY